MADPHRTHRPTVSSVVMVLLVVLGLVATLWRPDAPPLPPVTTDLDRLAPDLAAAIDAYRAPRRIVGVAIHVTGLLVPLWFVLSRTGRRLINRIAGDDPTRLGGPLRAAALGVTVWGTAMLLGLPLRAWAEIIQDGAWGVRTASAGQWWYDTLLLDTLEILLVGLLSAAFIVLLRARPRAWATDVVIAGTLLVALAALVWPMLILPLTATFTDLDDGPTAQAVRDTVEAAGLDDAPIMVEVRSERDIRANAVVYGIGPSSRIVIDDNLLALPVDDVVTIVAHELAHHVHRDVERGVAGTALLLVILALTVRGTWNHPRVRQWIGGDREVATDDPRVIPVVLAVAMGLSLVLEPAALWQSRRVEASADAASYELGASPATMVVVQRRLSIVNLSPLERPTWHQVLFSTHPTSADRIRAAVARAEADGLDLPTREDLDDAERRLQVRWRQPD